MAAKKGKPHPSDEDSDERPAKKKGGSSTVLLVGGGCAILLLCLICSGGGAGIWYWQNSPANKDIAQGPGADKPKGPIDKIIDDVKAKNPILGTAPVGKTPENELAPPVDVFDFTLRVPKGMVWSEKNKREAGSEEIIVNTWHQDGIPQKGSFIISRLKLSGPAVPAVTWLIPTDGKFKSEPGAKVQFDFVHMPQPIEINGLTGARSWQLVRRSPEVFQVTINYRYHVDGHVYLFAANPFAPTEEEVLRKSDLIDVAMCTFRKR